MFFGEVVAVMTVFSVFGLSFTILGVSFLGVVKHCVQGYLNYLERSLELRRFETESRNERARVDSHIPVWVDRTDPLEVAAWNRAVAETWRMSAHAQLAKHPMS